MNRIIKIQLILNQLQNFIKKFSKADKSHSILCMFRLVQNSQSYCVYSKSLIGSVIGSLIESFIESFERVSKWKLSVNLNSGLTSDTLNIPTGLVIVISITFAKKHAIIQLGKS